MFVRRPVDVVQVAVATSNDSPPVTAVPFFSATSRRLPLLPLPLSEIFFPLEKGLFPETSLEELSLPELPSPKVFFFPQPLLIASESSLVKAVVVDVAWMVPEEVMRVMLIKHDGISLAVFDDLMRRIVLVRNEKEKL